MFFPVVSSHSCGRLTSSELPSPRGPRHPGQFSADSFAFTVTTSRTANENRNIQYALLRIALPDSGASTAVMSGNLTNAVLLVMQQLSGHGLAPPDARRLKDAMSLLAGFLGGCLLGAGAVFLLADWAWVLPVALAALAIAVP